MGGCVKCDKENEVRRLIDGLCSVCSKRKAKTVVDAPTSNSLNAGNLRTLPHQKHQIQPNDSVSMIGSKRQRLVTEEEYESP
jgi:hypothetical protein